MSKETEIRTNLDDCTFTVVREFDAPLALVWRAYTEASLLDQWWGPRPWRAETKDLEFRAGGMWLYAMIGPEGERHWGRMNYTMIEQHKGFEMEDVFCDEHGTTNTDLPVSRGSIRFEESAGTTRVEWKTQYSSIEALNTVIAMGMEQGVRICVEQLVEVLSTMN